jgi:hypothetical protein
MRGMKAIILLEYECCAGNVDTDVEAVVGLQNHKGQDAEVLMGSGACV